MDAVTLALANKYTDSKQIGGVTKNRVDLADYGISLNTIIITGGVVEVDYDEELWTKLDTDARVSVKVLSGFNELYDLWCDVSCRAYVPDYGMAQAVVFSRVLLNGYIVDVSIHFNRNTRTDGTETIKLTVISSVAAEPGQ